MEEEMKMAETSHGDAGSTEEESGVDMSSNRPEPTRRGRGMSEGSKKLQVCITDVNLLKLPSGISNGGSTQAQRGRGSTKNKAGPGQDERGADLPNGDSNPPKSPRGRPKGSSNMKRKAGTSGEEDEGSSASPRKRGRPKKMKPETEVSSEESGADVSDENINSPKRGRGRPKTVVKSVSNGIVTTSHRGRGRPKKEKSESGEQQDQVTDGSQPAKRGRGRPKGSQSKKLSPYKTHGKVGRPKRAPVSPVRMEVDMVRSTTRTKRGRPSKHPAKRGRPSKYPLVSPDELKKPKVWKPLGRPRKYPRADPPEEATPTPHRGRGRPHKSESKRGAHLRKISRKYPLVSPDELKKPNVWKQLGRPRKYPRADPPEEATLTPRRGLGRPRKSESKRGAHLRKNSPFTSPSSPSSPGDETPSKRGRPSGTAKGDAKDGTARKRGRPKRSISKNEARNETQPASALPVKRPHHSKAKDDLSTDEEDYKEGKTEEEAEHDEETMTPEDEENTEETVIGEDGGFGALDGCDLPESTAAVMN